MKRRTLLCAFATTGLALAQQPGSVQIAGDVKRTLVFDVAELRAFDPAAQRSLRQSQSAGGAERSSVQRGVALRALLEQAGLAEHDRLDWRKTVVISIARDGYRAVFSWPELVNTEGGDQVMVVYERDGAPLAPGEGPLALVAPADLRSGPRHVKWLQRVEVRILRD
jgi:DMSO/TMAO reductase YedYZ molybdopterin-dependent catalytic subunit